MYECAHHCSRACHDGGDCPESCMPSPESASAWAVLAEWACFALAGVLLVVACIKFLTP